MLNEHGVKKYMNTIRSTSGRFLPLTAEQIEFIKSFYPTEGNSFCAEKLKISRSTVTRNAQRLGLSIVKWDAPEGFKVCYSCKQTLPLIEFHPKALTQKTKTAACKNCQKEYRREREEKLKQSVNGKKDLTADNLLNGARFRSRIHNIPFSLDKAWILENLKDFCPIFGTSFLLCSGKIKNESPSIDRLIPSQGYTKENCRIISFKANRMKSDGTLDELEKVVAYIKANL